MTVDNIDRLCAELPPIVTVDEVAKLLRYNPVTIGRWLETGFLPGSKLGKEWRILREDVRQLLVDHSNAERITEPADPPTSDHAKNNEGDE
jgi:excisionase family DNA binding protein